MSKLSLDRDKVDYAKNLAEQIVNPVQHYIDRHTTDSIERSVLRLMGVSGPAKSAKPKAPQGVLPKVNELAGHLGRDKLARGAGYWMGLAGIHNPGLDANALADGILSGKIDLDALGNKSPQEINRACEALLQPQLGHLRKNREKKGKRPDWANPTQPLRYVIVATGNIHEDILQAQAAAEMGADIIAVIRSTAQSLLDYVPEGATTEGFGGTYATQENFRLMRQALDEMESKLKRRVALCNYSSGLCMPEIAVIGALEGVDYLLNDAMYGILFRDINMQRNFVDQFFSRRICALSGIIIQTGEDNYLTTAESFKYWYQVLASHFINHAFAKRAGINEASLALGHAFEMDPNLEDSILFEWAQAQLVRELFPRAPLKFMPPTKHKTGDIFFSYLYDGMFNLAGTLTGQSIQLLGMHTEAIHNPFIQDRFLSLKNANYIFNAAKNASDEITFQPNGKIARRARQVLDDGIRLLKKVRMRGMFRAIEEGAFANVRRSQKGGKGTDGVFHKDRDYFTPLQNYLTPRAFREEGGRRAKESRERRRYGSGGRRPGRMGDRKSSRSRGDRGKAPLREKRASRSHNDRGGRNERKESQSAPQRENRGREEKQNNKRKGRQVPQEKTQSGGRARSDRSSARNNGPRKTRPQDNGRKSAKRDLNQMSEEELQRQFHEQMKQSETEKKGTKPMPRRKLEVEKSAEGADPEETLKVLPETVEPKPLPRRSLSTNKPETSLPRRELKGDAKTEAPKSPAKSPSSDASLTPLPRRKLNVEGQGEAANAKEKSSSPQKEESES